MSLILEALKKLERDKQVDGRTGFLVMAARPWPTAGENRRMIFIGVAAGAVVMMVLGAGLALWVSRSGARPPVAHAPAPAAPATAAAVVPATAPPAASSVLPASVSPPAAAPVVPAPASNASSPPSTRRAAGPSVAAAPPVAASASVDPVASETLEPRSPVHVLTPTATPASTLARFRLTAISERDGKPVAILNERLVHEGDSFDDVTVVRIGAGEVELTVGGKPLVVRF